MDPAGGGYEFGPFRLDARRHLLLRDGRVIPLTPKAYDLLLTLVSRGGALLTKQQLMSAVWGETAVEENNLNQGVSALRKALGDGRNGVRYIETVPRLGYRFVAEVRATSERLAAPAQAGGSRVAVPKFALALALTLAVTAAASAVLHFRTRSTAPRVDRPRAIADALAPPLTEDMNGRPGRGVRNVAAHEQYIRGRFFWNQRSRDGLQRALQAFQESIEHDPTYAGAYAGLADCYNLLPEYGLAPAHEAMPRARAAALQALRLDPALAEAHTSLAYTLANFDFDFPNAERVYRRAIDLMPGYATAHQWYAEYLGAMGRGEEAVAAYRRARALDPLSPIINALAELSYVELHQYERAAQGLRRVIALHPRFGPAHFYLADVYKRQGRFAAALDELEKAERLEGGSLDGIARLRRALAREGVAGFWRQELATELRQAHPSPYIIARLYVQLGQRERALEWLEKAHEERDRFLVFVKRERAFHPLASNPRFQALLRRIGF